PPRPRRQRALAPLPANPGTTARLGVDAVHLQRNQPALTQLRTGRAGAVGLHHTAGGRAGLGQRLILVRLHQGVPGARALSKARSPAPAGSSGVGTRPKLDTRNTGSETGFSQPSCLINAIDSRFVNDAKAVASVIRISNLF